MTYRATEPLPRSEELVHPPAAFLEQVLVPDPEAHYRRSLEDLEAYWHEVAQEFEWIEPWKKVLDGEPPNERWFVGGRCNITSNCLDRHARSERRNKLALLWVGENGTERFFTFGQLHRAVSKLASALRQLGIRKGDRVAIYMPLTPEGIFAMLACARIGAIHSVIYAGLGSGAVRDRILDAAARLVITADTGFRRGKAIDLKAILDEALAETPCVERVIVHRRAEPKRPLAERELDFDEVLASGSTDCPAEPMDSEDWLFILYTSGSTGKPKGCAYVHGGYMVGATHLWKVLCDVHEDDLYWCMSDIGWIVGHSIMVYGPWCNGTSILVREGAPDYPHPGIAWEIVERYGVTKLFTAPTGLRMFMRFGPEWPRRYDLSTLRLIACAGEPLNPEAFRWALEYLMQGRGPVLDNWWQTETAGPVIATWPAMPAKPGKAGKPLPGYRAEVLAPDGSPVPPNTEGLLCLRGPWPQRFRTIWGAHERYEEYFRTIPGVYVAGDAARYDEDGYIEIIGRIDDVLNVAGHRIGTADVESALVSHPAVAEAAAIGLPDPLKGEAIKAFVVLRVGHAPGGDLSAELVERVRHLLGPIATPSAIEFVERLPKTRSGKILRRVLKARELGQDPGDLTTIEE
jgi:acetyl-CoA synthetase